MATPTQEKAEREQSRIEQKARPQGETQDVEIADTATTTRYERGLKKMKAVYGVPVEEYVAPLRDLGRYMIEFPYGDIYSRDGLALREREIVTVAMLTALSGREPQLRVHIASALRAGVTADELYEVMLHSIIFAGFPTAINALTVLNEFVAEQQAGQEKVWLSRRTYALK
jgi:4-carboxymuconolactone decarboxylase